MGGSRPEISKHFSGMCNYPCYLPVTYLDLAYLYNIVVKNLFGEGQNTLLFLEIGNMYGARYEKTIFFLRKKAPSDCYQVPTRNS